MSSPKNTVDRKQVTQAHLHTIGMAFKTLQGMDMDETPAYAALEWLWDSRIDLLESTTELLAICAAAGIDDNRITGEAVSRAARHRDYYGGKSA